MKEDPYPPPVAPMHDLVRAGEAKSEIVIASDASDLEVFAAREFVRTVKRISIVELKVLYRSSKSLHPIYLGEAARKLQPERSWEKLGRDGFLLKSCKEGVYIAGGKDLGTLFGVYHFLETQLGVRWFMPGDLGQVIPKTDTVQIGTFDHTEIPSFPIRRIETKEWALRNKTNVDVSIHDQEVGVRWKWNFHTFFKLIPPDATYDAHPEWFAITDGVRHEPEPNQHGMQLCTSNPEVIKQVSKNIVRIFDQDPTLEILSLGPQDGGGFCECEKCVALDEERPSEEAWHARYSRRLALFNNEVAKRVGTKYPDKLIKVGAYAMYLRVPQDPDYLPEPNLAIQICHTYSCNNHPITSVSCPGNRQYFAKEIEAWSRLTDHLFIYEYYNKGAWGGLPYWQVHVMREDMPYYHELGAEAFYTQPPGRCWSSVGLNHYIAAKLAWNVNLDVDKLLEDFYQKFYGEAASAMSRYWQTLERAFLEADQCLSPFGLKWTTLVAPDFFTPEILAEMDKAVTEAEGLAKNEVVKHRVGLCRIMVDFTTQVMHYIETIRAPFDGVDLSDGEAVKRAHKEAIKVGEPLSAQLKTFCRKNDIPAYDRLIAAHRSVRLIVDLPDRQPVLR